jgi:hypothetical protein
MKYRCFTCPVMPVSILHPLHRLSPFNPVSAKIQTPFGARGSVRFGSLADILRCESHVRFTPESGHGAFCERAIRLETGYDPQSLAHLVVHP